MLYQIFEPTPDLAEFVRFFWALEGTASPGEEFVHRSMADGCVEMVFHYRGLFSEINEDGSIGSSPVSNIQAQSTQFRRFSTNESFGIFGAYLFPYTIPRLFGIPASELTNLSPELGSVLSHEGREVEERICSAATNGDRVKIFSTFLRNKSKLTAPHPDSIQFAVRTILDSYGQASISDLAAEHSLSRRQFERRFRESAGLSPKLYSRVVRFQAATQRKLDGVRNLTDIAYACGYYDQSHFINDFREFSGYTPKEYFWRSAEGTQYMDA